MNWWPVLLVGFVLTFASCAYRNPVVVGNYPDPSTVVINGAYWTVTTSSDDNFLFPILRSTDLINWSVAGSVFKTKPPWSTDYYWAPQLYVGSGTVFVYYTAGKTDRYKCVAVATASKPQGPYSDGGALACDPCGFIDPTVVVDHDGTRYLVWKHETLFCGDNAGKTEFYAQRLSATGTKLEGERRTLFMSSPSEKWEANNVSGPLLIHRGDTWYLFYTGGTRPEGQGCMWAVGVARSKSLFGTFARYSGNPILTGNGRFYCPGQGSVILGPNRSDYFLYAAYSIQYYEPTVWPWTRSLMLDRVEWDIDGWPHIGQHRQPTLTAPGPSALSIQWSQITSIRNWSPATWLLILLSIVTVFVIALVLLILRPRYRVER